MWVYINCLSEIENGSLEIAFTKISKAVRIIKFSILRVKLNRFI